MAKTLSIITKGIQGGLPVQNQGLKLSKTIAIEKIELHDGFRNLYTIKAERLERIEKSMQEHGFEQNRPIDIWITDDADKIEHFYLIDGHTRVTAAKNVGLTTVPYYEHHFESYNEALLYAIHTQVDRRNTDGIDFLNSVKFLIGCDYIKEFKGNKNAKIADILGVSEKTVERGKYVIEHASQEQWEAIKNEDATVNSVHTQLKDTAFFEKNATAEQKAAVETGAAEIKEINAEIKAEQKNEKTDSQITVSAPEEVENADSEPDVYSQDDFDDITDALEDSSGDPKGISISDHSDHIERPTNKLPPKVDSEHTKERRKAYETGFTEGFTEASLYVIGKLMRYDAPYVYDSIFGQKEISFDFLTKLLSENRTPQESSDIHKLRQNIRDMSMNDFNPHPLDPPATAETENDGQVLDYGDVNSIDDSNETVPSDFDIEFTEEN